MFAASRLVLSTRPVMRLVTNSTIKPVGIASVRNVSHPSSLHKLAVRTTTRQFSCNCDCDCGCDRNRDEFTLVSPMLAVVGAFCGSDGGVPGMIIGALFGYYWYGTFFLFLGIWIHKKRG